MGDIYHSPVPLEARSDRLGRGETLSTLLRRLQVSAGQIGSALAALTASHYVDLRRLRPGLAVTAYMQDQTLAALAFAPAAGQNILVKRQRDGAYIPVNLQAKRVRERVIINGHIEKSLYEDARKYGISDQHIVDFARVFAYDLDFQREVHPGDSFELVFDVQRDEQGDILAYGDVLYAALAGKTIDKAFYRFKPADEGIANYFTADGESARRFLMKTPINGARLSSSFGRRRHPISGYTRLHKGTDFAAPTGTPVYAAGHGVVERASYYGGYGHYVRIRHANGYKTAYAHLSRYGKGIKSGRRVRQGDVIGYVGSTGVSTGPHLHYEVYVNGKPVNAMRLKLPKGRKLKATPAIMQDFIVRRDEINSLRRLDNAVVVAQADIPPSLVNRADGGDISP